MVSQATKIVSRSDQKKQKKWDGNTAKSTCPYCVKAIQTLKDLGQSPKVVELDEVTEGGAQHEYLKKKTGQRTVPAIFIKTQFIGGNSDLQALHAKNQLKPLL